MPNTLDDITIPSSDWLDVYATTGVTVGKSLYLINKSSSHLVMRVNPTKPTDVQNGIPILPGGDPLCWVKVSSGATGVWVKSLGIPALVNVQEI